MKRLSFVLVVFLVSLLMTNSALALDFNEVVMEDGVYKWSNPNNWMGAYPDGTVEVKIRKSDDDTGDICTLDSTEIYPYTISARMRVYEGATLNIVAGGTLNGPGWFRIGSNGYTGTVNQSDGTLRIRNAGGSSKLVMGDSSGGVGLYNMTGGTMTYDKTDTGPGWLALGNRGGTGTLTITGDTPTIDMGRLYIGGERADRASTGTLEFNLTGASEGTVSPVEVKYTRLDPDGATSTAALVVNLVSGDDPTSPILLVENSDATAVLGRFDTFNGGSGAEGATVVLGSTDYTLTYRWDSVTETRWAGNDIALIPEPATLVLLGLGSLVALRRKK